VQAGHQTKITKLFFHLLRGAIPVTIVLLTIRTIQARFPGTTWNEFWNSTPPAGFFLLLITFVVLLGFLNWFLEAWKWKAMSGSLYLSGWNESIKSVLIGISLGFITPGRVGDFFGKTWYTKPDHKFSAIAIAFLSGIVQSAITLLAGLIAIVFVFIHPQMVPELSPSLMITSGVVLLIAIILHITLLFFPGIILKKTGKIRRLNNFSMRINDSISQVNSKMKFYYLQIASLRYLVFLLQFVILLKIFNVEGSFAGLSILVALVFLCTTFMPSVFLGKLGIREAFSVLLIGIPAGQPMEVLAASLLLWLINQFLPAMIGCFFIFRNAKPKETV
jgi:hypothetical protein